MVSSTHSEASEEITPAASEEDVEKLPGHQGLPLSSPIPSSAETMSTAATSKKTVLLVEDNLVNSRLGQRMLTTLGYNVLLAYNGLEALEAVRMSHDSIFVVLMDLQVRCKQSSNLYED